MHALREFEKDQPQPGDESMASNSSGNSSNEDTSQAHNELASSVIVHQQQLDNPSPFNGQRYSDLFEQSMDMATDNVTSAFDHVARNTSNIADEAPMTFVEDSSDPEEDMDFVQDPHITTSAFAHHTVIQSHPKELRQSNPSEESEEASLLALGSGDEYEMPLGPQGISYSDTSSSPHQSSATPMEQDYDDDEDVSGMDMDVSADASGNGMFVSDGQTSRRISVGGTLRRGSLAPGHAALAMLDAVDEDTQEYDKTQVAAEETPRASPQPTPRQVPLQFQPQPQEQPQQRQVLAYSGQEAEGVEEERLENPYAAQIAGRHVALALLDAVQDEVDTRSQAKLQQLHKSKSHVEVTPGLSLFSVHRALTDMQTRQNPCYTSGPSVRYELPCT